MRTIFTRSAATAVAAAALLCPTPGAGQVPLPPEAPAPPPTPGIGVAVAGGIGWYEIAFDDDGAPGLIEGVAQVVGVVLDLPLSSWLFLEPALTRVALDDADAERYGGGNARRWQLEFSLRGEVSAGLLRPYLTAGIGGFFHFDEDRPADRDFVTASYGLGAGVRAPVPGIEGLELRAEGRYRTFDDARSTINPLLVAVGWRF